MTPDNDTVFELDDLVWVVGDKGKIQELIKGE
jgi:CPA2 family monovalent cation:H+ antiporter-2